MMQIRNFNSIEDLINFLGQNKLITEKANYNSNIYTLNNSVLAKIFINDTERNPKKNIYNLKLICENEKLREIDEIVFPKELITLNDNIVGYTMDFIKGLTFDKMLENPNINNKTKLYWFEKIYKIINNLPEEIFIGDLYYSNIMINENGEVRLIDIDGFSHQHGYILPSPFSKSIRKNNDYLCLLKTFFDYFLIDFDYFNESKDRKERFKSYLINYHNISNDFIKFINDLENNIIHEYNPNLFKTFKDLTSKITKEDFYLKTNILNEDIEAYNRISEIISSRRNNIKYD